MSSPPILFSLSFIVTTFLLQWWTRPSYPTALWLLLGCVGAFWVQRSLAARVADRRCSDSSGQRVQPGEAHTPILLLSCVLGVGLALWNVARTESSLLQSSRDLPLQTPLHIEGMVTGLPESREGNITYALRVRTPVRTHITVRTRSTQAQFTHGDIVHFNGTLERIPPPYEKYFRAHGIVGSVANARLIGTGKREGSLVLHLLAQWNTRIVTRIRALLPEPEASLLAGLLLGETGGFSRETLTTFRIAGLTHILAISGYNITLVLIALSALTAKLPSLLRISTAVIGIILFTLFVGGSPSAIRAAFMGSLGLLALHTQHLPETRRTMLLAAFLMLLWNPMQLWWDASFQLSFLAVIGITELQPLLKKILKHLPETMGIRETLTVTLAAQCTALPWAAALFGNIPLLSPLANILVAPAIPFIMLTGPIALLGGTVHDLLGHILAFPCWVALQWIIRIAETITLLPLASIPFPQQVFLLIFLYYAALLTFLLRNRDPLASLRLSTNDRGRASHPPAKGELSAPRWDDDQRNETYGRQRESPDGAPDRTSP